MTKQLEINSRLIRKRYLRITIIQIFPLYFEMVATEADNLTGKPFGLTLNRLGILEWRNKCKEIFAAS